MQSINDAITLNNGYKIPCVGYGTWKMPSGDEGVDAVVAALEAGYAHIDTAAIYENEKAVGDAVKKSGVPREEIFVTSKVWNTERGYDKALAAFEVSLEKLGFDYLDLYLIHWPAAQGNVEEWSYANSETWRALESLYADGRVRSIGVSNFKPHHLEALMDKAIVQPMVNQIEYHPGFVQVETSDFCRAHDILIEAWSPLGKGKIFQDETLLVIAQKYRCTVAQLCIRWCLQKGTVPLPKSVTPARIIENTHAFGFAISPEDMALIDALPLMGWSGLDPDEITF